jgi:hypothetical protein
MPSATHPLYGAEGTGVLKRGKTNRRIIRVSQVPRPLTVSQAMPLQEEADYNISISFDKMRSI